MTMRTERRMWTPSRHYRPMSTTGSILAWFFFWWVLIPVYAVYAVGWVVAVVVVNTLIVAWLLVRWAAIQTWLLVRWVSTQTWRLAVSTSRRVRPAA